jgi:hypothetical protein
MPWLRETAVRRQPVSRLSCSPACNAAAPDRLSGCRIQGDPRGDPRSGLYGPGLARLGLDTGRLILVEATRPADRLWAFEEALRTPGLAGAVAELDRIDPKAARRLQLAAEAGGTTGIVLQTGNRAAIAGAMTGWSVAALPGAPDRNGFPRGFAAPRWRLALQRSRIGHTGQWDVEARHDAATDRIALAAALCDRAPAPLVAGQWAD